MKIEIDGVVLCEALGQMLLEDYSTLQKDGFGVDNVQEMLAAYRVMIVYYTSQGQREVAGYK